MRYLLIVAVLLAYTACTPESQIRADQAAIFLKYYGNTTAVEGASAQEGVDVQQTADGGYIVLGNSNAFSTVPNPNNHDLYLIKTDAEGNEVWSNTYGTTDRDERAVALRKFSDGSLLLLGNRKQLNSDSSKIALWRVNVADGGVVWETTLRESSLSAEYAYDVQLLAGDSIMLTGSTTAVDITKSNYNPDTDVEDIYTAVLDADGVLAWQRIYGFPHRDEGIFIQQLENELIVIGTTAKVNEQTTAVEEGLFLIKYQRATGLVNGQNNFSIGGRNLHSLSASYDAGASVYRVLVQQRQNRVASYGIANLNQDLIWDEAQDFDILNGAYQANPSITENLHARLIQLNNGRYYIFNASYFGAGQLLDWKLMALNADLTAVEWTEQYGGLEDDFVGELRPVYGDVGLENQGLQGFLLVGTINFSTNPMVAFMRTNELGKLQVD